MIVNLRPATVNDKDAMLALLPRLADFTVPKGRNPDDLWHGDRDMLLAWLEKTSDQLFVEVAVDENDRVLGLTIVSLREEMLSHEPSSHLEVLVVAEDAQGHGLGRTLIDSAEREAKKRGALSMTLHVFANNTRARGLYEKSGFDGELLRYYKPI